MAGLMNCILDFMLGTLFLRKQGGVTNSPILIETAMQTVSRFLECMVGHRDYQTVVAVTHRMLMRQFVPDLRRLIFCQVIECEVEI